MMKAFFVFLLAVVSFAGCAGIFPPGVPRDPVERLRYDIDRILDDSLFIPTRAGVKVVSLESGEVLYERDSRMLMHPASNMKLLTSSAAIALLGRDFPLKTAVFADTTMVADTLQGNIYFKGFGNPDLKSADLDSLVAQIRAAGIAAVRGNIVADVSYFDDLYWGEGWMWDDEPYQFEAFITPLSINDNCIKIVVTPGANHGDSARVTIEPATSYVTLINHAITVTDSVLVPLDVTRLFKERLNTIVVNGQIRHSSRAREFYLSVWKPELYAAHLLKETLERNGITVGGSTLIGKASPEVREIARHIGRFDSMLVNLNKISDNLSAENILKIIGAEKRGIPGSARSGIYETKLFLSQFGIDTTTFLMVDGSGVSHYNLLTAEMLVQLLVGMARQPEWFPLFYESLPLAGVDGTLSNRMKGTPAEGNLRAKTGSISGVSTLSGYVRTQDGEMLAFSILMQHFIGGNRPYREVQDKIGAILAGFSRKRNPPLPTP
ncbi:MAG TPA: D-alanyl-D-alanine carboxypeptidase/D-alanyl-D-alanine-endopeptidase [Bacteroidota bacterium]|nr:D-alanyl-D-alanine carboxypeptidase/D-alanyl-D-alanine-endopeptidase [Bacteroidota bacterium]